MPIDLEVTYTDGTTEILTFPYRMMRGQNQHLQLLLKIGVGHIPTYTFEVSKEVKSVEIDPSKLMADIYPSDNKK